MVQFSSDLKHSEATATLEEYSLVMQIHQHDESEGSEFIDDHLRMKEQPFEKDHPGNQDHQ